MNWTHLIESGRLGEIRKALRDGEAPKGPDKYGYPLVHVALIRDDSSFRIVGWLLDAGHDPNQKDRARFKQTPLHLAAEQADLETMELLLEHGALPDVPDNWGNGPAWKALHAGGLVIHSERRPRFEKAVRMLVAAGADLDRLNQAGKSCRAHLRDACWSALADL